MNIYLDNAATTQVDKEVFERMSPFFVEFFGNPSSTHEHGRKAKAQLEAMRKQILKLLNAKQYELIFTSGATEAINLGITSIVANGIERIITVATEHKAVLETVKQFDIEKVFLNTSENGQIDISELAQLLTEPQKTLVCIMHANNEIGVLQDITKIASICKLHKAQFFCDTVQTVGLGLVNIEALHTPDMMVGSGHKFYGPKGTGFLLYKKDTCRLKPLLSGGGQEKGYRSGTENLPAIVGMTHALQMAIEMQEVRLQHLTSLKNDCIDQLKSFREDIVFNNSLGENTHPSIINFSLPVDISDDMLLFNLDLNGISVSGGSACSSGAQVGSHVLKALQKGEGASSLRVSIGKNNTKNDIDRFVEILKEICASN